MTGVQTCALPIYLQKGSPDVDLPETDDLLSSRGILWSLTHGETVHSRERALAIDGINNVSEFLESVENEKIGGVDFLELRACDESCAGGILLKGNRFLIVERLKNMAREYTAKENDAERKLTDGFINIKEHSFLGKIEPRSMEKLDEDLTVALRKMERKRRLMCFLPGFDCAACGAPDCQTLSEDIVQGRAQISQCVFLQQQMIKQKIGRAHV